MFIIVIIQNKIKLCSLLTYTLPYARTLMVLIDVVISFLNFKIVTSYNEKHPVGIQ